MRIGPVIVKLFRAILVDDRPAITSSYFGNHSIRTRDWRLIVYEDGSEELYNHRADPDEFVNLADDAVHKEVRGRLIRWLPKEAAPEFKMHDAFTISEDRRTLSLTLYAKKTGIDQVRVLIESEDPVGE